MSYVINSRALTGEKPCINKAIHALLMHGYATFSLIVPGPHDCCCYEIVLPGPRTSIVRGNCVRETSVKRRNKIMQEITRNVANFQFLCNNSDRTWFFNALTVTTSLGRCWNPRPPASVFNISLDPSRMLMREKTCLIPIMLTGMSVITAVPLCLVIVCSSSLLLMPQESYTSWKCPFLGNIIYIWAGTRTKGLYGFPVCGSSNAHVQSAISDVARTETQEPRNALRGKNLLPEGANSFL